MKYPGAESSYLEFKRELPKKDQIVKTVIGFCNQNGGVLVIGVDDDGTIRGVAEKEIEITLEAIEQSIYDACSPLIIPRVSIQRFGDKSIIAIEVSRGMNKPYHRRVEGPEKGTYIRLGRHTARATRDIVKELEWQATGIDFEAMPVYRASIDDIDLEKFNEFLKERKNNCKKESSEELLKAYNIIVYEHSKKYPTTLGILSFGHQPQLYFTEAMIICSHIRGVKGREVIATVDCEGPLFNQFQQAFAFILERLYHSFVIRDLKRDEQLEIPEVAIREALLNAIIHRNYHIKAPTKIAIYDDRVEFFSPGQFAGPLNTDDLQKGISYLRNPVLCKILREAGYIEKLGSGFINIFESYDERGLKSPQVIEGENYIKCILPRGTQGKETLIDDGGQKLEALFVRQHEVTVKDVTKALKVSRSTALRRLNVLLKDNKVVRVGETKASRYRLKKSK